MEWRLDGGDPRNALIAVADPSLSGFLAVHLQDRGCRVSSLARADQLGPAAAASDLLIADFDLLRANALEPRFRPSQILALAAEIGPGDEERAADLGACVLLRVPFEDAAELAVLLDEMVAGVAQPGAALAFV